MEPGVPISVAAQRTGVEAATLRAWQRRYGLGASARSSGGHRRYTDEDLERLRIARNLIRAGVRAAQAARTALGSDPDQGHATGDDLRRLQNAALALDGQAASALLSARIRNDGPYTAWEDLARPALRFVDSCEANHTDRIAAEHLLSHEIATALMTHVSRRPVLPRGPGCVLLACAPEEHHSLPLLALAATLADAGIPAEILGARTPTEVLHHALSTQEAPSIAVVLAVRADSARPAALLPGHDTSAVVAAGPGWQLPDLPAGVAHANGLGAAAGVVRALLGA